LAHVADLHISTQRSALGHRLYAQTPVESTKGTQGTRFDLYDASSEPRGVIIIVFVTEAHRVSIMLRGPLDRLAALDEASDWVLAELEVPACNRRYRSICEGPQPPPFRLDPGPFYSERSDERLCAHVADILRSTRSSDRRGESSEFTSECEATFAERKAELGAEAADELTRCVISADSFAALLRCNAHPDMTAVVCDRVERIDEDATRFECGDQFRTLKIERGPLAADDIATCVLAAATSEELEHCKH
jgi:hypothetical protein